MVAGGYSISVNYRRLGDSVLTNLMKGAMVGTGQSVRRKNCPCVEGGA